MRNLRSLALGSTFATAALLAASPAQAALVLVGVYGGNDCSGQGGFNNCYATQNGVVQGGSVGSPTIYKLGSDGEIEIASMWDSITGTEFDIGYTPNTLSFTYTPGAGDPTMHYFSIKQANGYALFYDATPITSASINLDTYFPRNPGWSHITFFDTGLDINPLTPVPEPATWAMLLFGFGAIGASLRTRNSRSQLRLRTA